MKLIKYFSATVLLSLGLVSCGDDFLDQEPDERIEITTVEQVQQMLTSAYGASNYGWLCELSSDNLMDNNAPHKGASPDSKDVVVHYNLSPYERMDDEIFRFEQVKSSTGTDSPSEIWESCYNAIATANHCLVYLDQIEEKERAEAEGHGYNPSDLEKAVRGEALLIRAYYHFVLVNIFSQAYKNDEASSHDIGIPYVTEPEDKVLVHYNRGTVTSTYNKIREDLEAGLQLVSNSYYQKPKWHFNVNAAHAFAARFYLYTRNYEKVIEHANAVLGEGTGNLGELLMRYDLFDNCTYGDDYANVWQSADLNNNLMLVATYSTASRRAAGQRYGQISTALQATIYHFGPNWRWYVIPCAYVSGMTFYRGNQDYGFMSMKSGETFEYTDKVAGIGYAHVVRREFTCTELLLERVEAKLLKQNPDIDGAVDDLIAYDTSRWTFTEDDARTFFAGSALTYLTRDALEKYYKDTENHNCFENWDFTQNMSPDFVVPANVTVYMNAVNDMRRYETNWEGLRFFDLKRWGIEYSHFYGVDNIEYKLTWNDPRRAIEIPQEVMAAGLEPSRPPMDYSELQQATTEIRKKQE
ncbi:MAG: RagB/SusD family nutrient uptake outer membrane protein [Prevotella sp.]|nr:RagB/SusD family nutrient uptake outer membrane protein [Prevotella sp.]